MLLWYALNVGFNLLNKTIFGYFPFPWTVSAVHVVVGTVYCAAAYAVGAKKASFGRKITKDEFATLLGPRRCTRSATSPPTSRSRPSRSR